MSEQGIGRSPFAVIAELASVIAVVFYAYAYFFFRGFMMAIDYQFLALFSAKDTLSYIVSSSMVAIVVAFVGITFGFGISPKNVTFKNHKIRVVFLLLLLSFGYASFFAKLSALGPSKSQLATLSLSTLYVPAEIMLASILLGISFLIVGIGFNKFREHGVVLRFTGYGLLAIATGLVAHASGTFYEETLHDEKANYCVESDRPSLQARLLLASDQNALFETETGELRALSFNAIKSISNKPCPPDNPAPKTQ